MTATDAPDELDTFLSEAHELDAVHEAHREAASLQALFRNAPSTAIVGMWRDGKHWETGQPLTSRESEALFETWCERFRCLPPTVHSFRQQATPEPVPIDQHPIMALPDDCIVRPKDASRMLGLPKTTMKRWIRLGKMPKPQKLVPGHIQVGWPARQLKALVRGEKAPSRC